MNINRNNYEVYFIDYHDGNLTGEQSAELFLFLELNPDLKEEFDNFSQFSLDIPVVDFPHRDTMKRGEINKDNFSWYMTASVEGDLSRDEQKMLDNFISNNPQFSNDAKLFHKAKLDSGSEIYPDKKSLKQPVPFVFNYSRTLNYAIAAMLFISLIGGGYFLYTKSQVQNSGGVAELPVEIIAPNQEIPTPSDSGIQQQVVTPENTPAEKILTEPQLAVTPQPKKKAPLNEINNAPKEEVIPDFIEEQPQVAETIHEKEVINEPVAVNDVPVQQPVVGKNHNDDDEYVSVWAAVKQGAEKNLRKAIKKDDDYTVANASEDQPIRILDVVSKGVEKISNDKISVDAAYADNGKVSGFRFAAGKFSIEKNNPE